MPTKLTPLYGDPVFKITDLIRDARRVLDTALKRPVTITRNDQHFALMPREEMARCIEHLCAMERIMAVHTHASALARGCTSMFLPGSLHWLKAFDQEDLMLFLIELEEAVVAMLDGRSKAGDVEAIIYEWEESGLAALSPDVRKAFHTPAQLEELTAPALVRAYTEVAAARIVDTCDTDERKRPVKE